MPQKPLKRPTLTAQNPLKRFALSALIIFHLVAIVVCYSGNWRKSAEKERLIGWLHPYLIGLNWHLDMFPVEWNTGTSADGPSQLVLLNPKGERLVALETASTKSTREREQQLMQIISTLIQGGEDDGASLLLESVVNHSESVFRQSFARIAIERRARGTKDFESLYVANVVRVGDRLQFVPVIEDQRTVMSLSRDANGERQ